MDDSLTNLAEQRLTKRWFSDVDFRPSPKNKSTIAAGKRSGFLCHLSWSRNVGNWRIRWRLDDGLMAPPWSHRGCTWVQAEWRNATASKQTRTTFDDWGLQAQILNHTVLLMMSKGHPAETEHVFESNHCLFMRPSFKASTKVIPQNTHSGASGDGVHLHTEEDRRWYVSEENDSGPTGTLQSWEKWHLNALSGAISNFPLTRRRGDAR